MIKFFQKFYSFFRHKEGLRCAKCNKEKAVFAYGTKYVGSPEPCKYVCHECESKETGVKV